LLEPMRIERGRGRATIVPQDLLPAMRAREPFDNLLRSVPTISGVADIAVRSLALRFDKPSRVIYDLSVSPRPLRIDTDKLPGALGVRGGAVRVTPKSISADRVGIEVLDSKATVSGELTDFQGGMPQATGRVGHGVIAPKLIDWIWLRAHLPERLKPAKPLNFDAQRVRWSKAGLDAVADATIDSGPSVGILEPGGEGWLILSDLAEHLGLRPRPELLAAFDAAGLKVVDRSDVRPKHARSCDETDPLHAARAAEVTSLWRLAVS
jgi:hypothetical protein